MSWIRSTGPLVSLALGLAFGTPAMAQVQANGSLTNFQFQLTDLTPDDGLEAGYTMPNSGSESSVHIGANLLPAGSAITGSAQGWLGSTAGNVSIAGASAGAWVQSNGLLVQGAAQAIGSNFYAIADTTTHNPWVEFNLSLAPHSALTISADYDLHLMTQHLGCAAGCEQVSLTALLHGFNVEQPYWGSTQFSVSQDWTALAAGALDRSGVLTLTLSNDTDDWHSGVLTGELRAEGAILTEPPPPVPEPATWALTGLGLAALGFARRRREG